ncbi:MAG TPA: hypothetical protein VK177_03485 [Flavobacteriales bacterium]|nr:hypothetical protein [Flavobacteriales bacterium]
MSNLTKALTLFTFLFIFCLNANAQQYDKMKVRPKPQTAIKKEKAAEVVVPADFPKYVDTGNPEADANSFRAAKEQWYALHPAEAQKINGEAKSQVITKTEFDKLPAEKQQAILNNPSRFKIVE